MKFQQVMQVPKMKYVDVAMAVVSWHENMELEVQVEEQD